MYFSTLAKEQQMFFTNEQKAKAFETESKYDATTVCVTDAGQKIQHDKKTKQHIIKKIKALLLKIPHEIVASHYNKGLSKVFLKQENILQLFFEVENVLKDQEHDNENEKEE